MNKNIKDIETILDFAGCYDWNGNGKIMIVKTNEGYDVNGFSFATLKAACDFIENFPHNSFASKTAKVSADMAKVSKEFAKVSARAGARCVGFGLRFAGRTLETIGVAIKNGLDK